MSYFFSKNNKTISFIIVLSFIVVLFSVISFFSKVPVSNHTNQKKSASFISFGTLIQLTAFGDYSQNALSKSKDLIYELESILSAKNSNSEISLINNSSGNGNFVKVSKDTFSIIQRSLYFSEISNGKFDISVKPISDLWDIGGKNPQIPDRELLSSALKLVGYENIKLKKDNDISYIMLDKCGMSIDVGGIAKGYASDKLLDIYNEYQVSGIINMGGNVITVGENPDSSTGTWKIAIPNPRGSINDAIMALNIPKDTTVVTSGDYQRFFLCDDKRYHHIIDPNTGYPASTGIISTTIIGTCSMDADALSTTIFLLGKDDGLKLIEAIDDFECIIIMENHDVFVSEGIKNGKFNLEILSPEYFVK